MKNTKIGWLLMPEKWIALDKQFHGSWGIWITLAVFFVSLRLVETDYSVETDIARALISCLITFVVGLGIEFYQKATKKGEWDVKDAVIMPVAGAVAVTIIIIIRTFTIG